MKQKLTVALAQINPIIGDIVGNTKLIISAIEKAKEQKADVVAFPEMAVIGYPAQDLLFRSDIILANLQALKKIAPHTKNLLAVAIGYCQPAFSQDKWHIHRQHLYNAYVLFSDGNNLGSGAKICLPSYSVFDDYRYFIPGTEAKCFDIKGVKIGVEICEDIWYKNQDEDHPIYACRPTLSISRQGADLILVLNASPYYVGKEIIKENLVRDQAKENQVPIFYVNMWGGNDKIIFDGNSLAADKNGNIIARGKSFSDDLLIANINLTSQVGEHISTPTFSEEKNIYNALTVGKQDYHNKCGLTRSIIGLSGGIDSAVVLALDVAALGQENILAILSPSRYSSHETVSDAIKLCDNFNVSYKIIPIEEKDSTGEWNGTIPEKYQRYLKYVGNPSNEVVFENMQAIDRMSILRAIANEENRLVSGTGNKSELATGYATVCGDLQADILVIGDLYKRQVFALARYINQLYKKEMIPLSAINRIPSAELSENQVDPFDYHRLDELVRLKVEEYISDKDLLNYAPEGGYSFTKEEIRHYSRLIEMNEHKRFKSGYILKVSPVAFGEDRRINTAKKVTLWD